MLINGDNWGQSDARIIAVSEEGFDRSEEVATKVVLRGPGEYEVGGVEIWATGDGEGRTIYVVSLDGVTVCYLGNSSSTLSEKKEARIGSVDVLIGPVGGDEAGGKKLVALAKKLGANYLIPIGFEQKDENIKRFLDQADREDLEPVSSLKVDKDSLPEGMEVVVLGVGHG